MKTSLILLIMILSSFFCYSQGNARFILTNDAPFNTQGDTITNALIGNLMSKFDKSRFYDIVTKDTAALEDKKFYGEIKLNYSTNGKEFFGCFIMLLHHDVHAWDGNTNEFLGVHHRNENHFKDYRFAQFPYETAEYNMNGIYEILYSWIDKSNKELESYKAPEFRNEKYSGE